jgi:uncharacterized protein
MRQHEKLSIPNTRFLLTLLAACGLLALTISCVAVDDDGLVAVPPLVGRIVDLTGTLTPDQKSLLEGRMLEFEGRKGGQLALLIIPSTKPEAIEQYSIRVADAWKIGRKDIDDGVILIVAKNDRRLRIEVGRGLEGAIPDVIAKRVITEIITPYFYAGQYYDGVDQGLYQLTKLIDGEVLPPPRPRQQQQYGNGHVRPDGGNPWVLAAVVLLLSLFLGLLVVTLVTPKLTGNAAQIVAAC